MIDCYNTEDSGGSAIEGEEGRRVHQGEGTKSSGLMMASTNDDVWQDEEWEVCHWE